MKQIMAVVGTRPEAIKMAPLVLELKRTKGIAVSVIFTGQHPTAPEEVFHAFGLSPDHVLCHNTDDTGLAGMSADLVLTLEKLFFIQKPDLVLVQGDTASAFAAGYAAFCAKIPVAHVEAGLRTYRMDAPFPEELYRRCLTLMSSLHFAPTGRAKRNLLEEGVEADSVYITGNTGVDALYMSLCNELGAPSFSIPGGKRILLFTAHRRENWGEPIAGMCRALCRLIREFPDTHAICPMHPNPLLRRVIEPILSGHERIQVIDPLDHVNFHRLMAASYLIFTDSGGVQEETVTLGIPTLVMRYSSERSEGIRSGVLKLAGSGEEGIYRRGHELLLPDSPLYYSMKRPSRIFGDGKASLRIARVLQERLCRS